MNNNELEYFIKTLLFIFAIGAGLIVLTHLFDMFTHSQYTITLWTGNLFTK